LVALEGRPEDYTARLENLITARRVGVTVLDEESHDPSGSAEPSPAGDAEGLPHPHRHDH
jgi:urease accessory protein